MKLAVNEDVNLLLFLYASPDAHFMAPLFTKLTLSAIR